MGRRSPVSSVTQTLTAGKISMVGRRGVAPPGGEAAPAGGVTLTAPAARIALGDGLQPSTEADEISLNVPVRLTNLAPEVKRGAVSCDVRLRWTASGEIMFTYALGRTEFAIDSRTGSYDGILPVRVRNGPPRRAVDLGFPILYAEGSYTCALALASKGGSFHPGGSPPGPVSGSPAGPPAVAPPWAAPQGTATLEVSGPIPALRR